jgi:hypothetical protein
MAQELLQNDFYPEGCTFVSVFMVFILLFLLFLFYNNQSVTLVSFTETVRTVGCLYLVSTHNKVLYIYTNVISLMA